MLYTIPHVITSSLYGWVLVESVSIWAFFTHCTDVVSDVGKFTNVVPIRGFPTVIATTKSVAVTVGIVSSWASDLSIVREGCALNTKGEGRGSTSDS